MFSGPVGVEYLNSFALVSYIPEPLAHFLDSLRTELVPNCFLRAHVTILPPRPIQAPAEKAWQHIRDTAYSFDPIKIELKSVEIFPVSDVIYVSIGAGQDEIKQMHQLLNERSLSFDEPFEFHPHVTLAQNLTPDQVDELSEVARKRWADYQGDRTFRVQTITFVQNTRWDGWANLAEMALGRLVAA